MTVDEIINALTVETPTTIDTLEAPGALRNSAIYYASVGWPVFPLTPGGKTPLTRHGFKDATTNLDQVNTWWATTPQANIGVPTGGRFDVIDIDNPHGFTSLTTYRLELEQAGHPLPQPLGIAHTGNGGKHWLIPPTGKGNATHLRPGIDYRGIGGYIVVPPSTLTNGQRYTWIVRPKPQLVTASGDA